VIKNGRFHEKKLVIRGLPQAFDVVREMGDKKRNGWTKPVRPAIQGRV